MVWNTRGFDEEPGVYTVACVSSTLFRFPAADSLLFTPHIGSRYEGMIRLIRVDHTIFFSEKNSFVHSIPRMDKYINSIYSFCHPHDWLVRI
jgi:hypothetical protein